MELSERMKKLPPYIFAELEKAMIQKKKEGVDLISLSIGDPDLPPPEFFIQALRDEVLNPDNHKYSFSQGERDFREAVVDWYGKRFSVELDPEEDVIALIGAKEGIANISRAFIDPGDRVLVPDPSYPVYANGSTILSEGVPVFMPLDADNGFKPCLDDFVDQKAKMMFLNYPNNPTAAVADMDYLREIVDFALENDVILCYDNSYSEITFDGYRAPSIMEVEGAKDVAIEFHSCSKTFNITGGRIGFAVGNPRLIQGLTKVKAQIDSGPPIYIQRAAKTALDSYNGDGYSEHVDLMNSIYAERRDVLYNTLRSMGYGCPKPKATFYLWVDCGRDSMEFAKSMLDIGVVVTPGIGFGEHYRNHVRFSITRPKEDIERACRRMEEEL